MIRHSLLTTAIVGGGLVATAGAAFAGNAPCENGGGHHHGSHSSQASDSSSGCSNALAADNSHATNTMSLLNQDQGLIGLNICNNHILDNVLNGNGSGNSI